MPGRSYAAGSGYRYGFNGKENDNEVKGEGNQQDYGMRIYDPRLGRFLSVDPITSKYPELTPYQFASNTPIWAIDLDGLEARYTTPQEYLYHGLGEITEAAAGLYDRVTGFFLSLAQSDDDEITKEKSIVTTNSVSLEGAGNMQSWIKSGWYAKKNMPALKLQNIYTITVKNTTKVELKEKQTNGNVTVATKTNLKDGSVEVKTTVKIPQNKVTKVPVKVSVVRGNDNTNQTKKTKVEIQTDTKPFSLGAEVEVVEDNNGNKTGKAGIKVEYEQKKGKKTTTTSLTVGKKF